MDRRDARPLPPSDATLTQARNGLLLFALFTAALSLRPQLVGIGPLLPRIQSDLAVSFAWSGLLATIPLLCMGVFAPLAPYVVRRMGTDRGLTIALLAIASFGLWRAAAQSPAGLLLTTFLVGIGLALGGTLLPMVVKQSFPDRPASATGTYVAGIQLGAGGSAISAVPIANFLGGWRVSLALFSLVALGTIAVWLAARRGRKPASSTAIPPEGTWRVLRRLRVWMIAAAFGLQSMVFYGLMAWLPSYFIEVGWPDTLAGALVAVLNTAGLLTSLTVPRLADRLGSRRTYLIVGAGGAGFAISGMLLFPALGWIWAVIAGSALALLFTMVLTLPLDVASDTHEAGVISAFVLGIGYTLAGISPAALGAIRDATVTFSASLLSLLPLLGLLIVLATWLSPQRLTLHTTAQ